MHLGHKTFIEESIKSYGLDKVLVLVEKNPRFKTGLAPYGHRRQMASLAFAENPQIVLYETATDNFPLTSTLPLIRAQYKNAQIHILMGEDVAKHIDSWESAEALLKGVVCIVGKRRNETKYGRTSSAQIRGALHSQKNPADIDPMVLAYINENKLYSS